MALAEDPSTPGVKFATGTASTITSTAFTPPANSLVVVMASGEWSYGLCRISVADSAKTTYYQAALASGTGRDGGVAAVYYAYFTKAPSSPITLTASFSYLGGGTFLDVRVLTGADPNQSGITGWGKAYGTYDPSVGTISLSTTAAGSIVYGISDASYTSTTFGPLAGTTTLGAQSNTTDQTACASWKTTPTTTPGTTLCGGNWGTYERGNVAAFEVVPVGGVSQAPPMPTFVDGQIVHGADLNAIGANINNIYNVTSGGARYQFYNAGGKGPIKPLTVLAITDPSVVLPSRVQAAAPFDTVYANTDSWWSPLRPDTMVVSTGGLWRLHFQIALFQPGGDSQIFSAILVNGSSLATNAVAFADAEGSAVGVAVTLPLPVNSQIACLFFFDSGNTTDQSPIGLCQFSAEWLSP